MQIHRIPFQDIPQLSDRDKAYAALDKSLHPFYVHPPSLEQFAQVIKAREDYPTDRKLLVEVLREQYDELGHHEAVDQQIETLGNPQTYTVTTAHQPSLFTGPLYYIYKICSTIHLTRDLNEAYPEHHFVPVFVSGGEDHDFEEINHFHLFGQTYTWEEEAKGPVGRLGLEGVRKVLEEVLERLGSGDHAESLRALLLRSFGKAIGLKTYGQAALKFTHELFRSFGLVVLNMDHPKLKAAFRPMLQKELFESPSESLILEQSAALEQRGYKAQATPRNINLFYMEDGLRERVVRENGHFEALNTDKKWSPQELETLVADHPESLSPNVVMRPLYQEHILPNLAYIGGGGELAYWMERRTQFEAFGIPYPMLVRRNSVLWIDKGNNKKREQLGIEMENIWEEEDALIRAFLERNASVELTFDQENERFDKLYKDLADKAKPIDPTVAKAILAEHARQQKSFQNLQGRIVRAEKQNKENSVNKIRKWKEKLFPNNGLQERHDNFMEFYLKYGPAYFEMLVKQLDPMESGFVVVVDAH